MPNVAGGSARSRFRLAQSIGTAAAAADFDGPGGARMLAAVASAVRIFAIRAGGRSVQVARMRWASAMVRGVAVMGRLSRQAGSCLVATSTNAFMAGSPVDRRTAAECDIFQDHIPVNGLGKTGTVLGNADYTAGYLGVCFDLPRCDFHHFEWDNSASTCSHGMNT